jgi:hypothetical protein
MYKAIKKFELNGQTYQIGDDFPVELFEDRLLRGKKIGIKSIGAPQKTKEVELITEDVKVKTDEVKKSKKNKKEEILTDDSSNVEVTVQEELVEDSTENI